MKRVLLSALLIGVFCFFNLPSDAQDFDWAAHFSSTSDVQVNSVVHDPLSDEISAIIVFQGTVSFNGGPVYTSFGDRDIMLVRMDADGDTLWTKQYGSSGKELPKDIAHDASGNIYATGSFSDGADFGGTILNSLDAEDVFLFKVNTDGTTAWAKNVAGGKNLDRGNSLIVDNTGNIHIVGFFKDSLEFENDTLVTNGKNNNFSAEYNNSGDFIKASHFINTTVNSDRFNSISLAHDGGTLISGFFRDSIKYEDPVAGWIYITSVGSDDMVLFKFNTNKEMEWVRTGGGTGPDRGYDAASDALGNVYLGGYFSATANFDSSDFDARDSRTLTTKGGIDLFVAKYNNQGTLQWIVDVGGTGEDIIRGVDVDQNLFHFAGHFSDTIITRKNDTLASTGPTDQDIYFSVTDLLGSLIAVGQTKGPDYETTQAMAYDRQGSEYIAGYFESATLEVGGLTPLTNGGGKDGILTKYSFPFSIALEKQINVSCNGGSDGELLVVPYFGKEPYDYAWSHDAGLDDSTATGLTAGTYKVVVTDGNSEKDSIEVEVTEPTSIQIDKSITDVSCNTNTDGEIDITVSGGTPSYTFAWSTSNGSGLSPTDEDQTGLRAGDYTVDVTDANGCLQDSTFTVTEPPELLWDGFNKGDVTIALAGDGWAKVLVSGGTQPYAYAWSNSGTTDSIYGLDGGSYNVLITDNYGCTKQSGNVVINEPGVCIVDMQLINNISCKDAADGAVKAIGSGGVLPYTYIFSSGTIVDDTIATDLGPGKIVVTMNDDVGCEVKDSIVIVEPAELVVTKTLIDANCYNVCDGIIDINVNGGSLPYSYAWDRAGETTEDLTGVCAGQFYTVTVTDDNGCIKENTGFVDQPDSIEFSFAVTDVTCFGGNNGAIDLTVTGGTSPYSYLWSNTLTSQDQSVIPAGKYWVDLIDGNGCMNSDTTIVNEPIEMIVISTELKPACFARTDGKAWASITGGNAPYTYLWDDPSAQTDSIAVGLDPNRSYDCVVLDANSCEASDTAYIYEQGMISATVDTVIDVVCFGASTGEIQVSMFGGEEPYNYLWVETGDTTKDLVGVVAGSYTMEATDDFGCDLLPDLVETIDDNSTEIVITRQEAFDVSCYNGMDGLIYLSTWGDAKPHKYSIDDGITFQTDTSFLDLSAGSYISVVLDTVGGCLKYGDTLTVGQPKMLVFDDILIDRPTHPDSANGIVTVLASGGSRNYQYSVNSGNFQFDSVFTDRAVGNDTVVVIDSKGCNIDSLVVLNAWAAVVIDSVTSSWLDPDGTITVYSSAEAVPLTYQLSGAAIADSVTSATMVTFTNLPGGNYTITLTDNVGNEDTDQVIGLSVADFGKMKVLLYPNPSYGQFTIEMENRDGEDLVLEIVSITGQLVYKQLHKYDGQSMFIRTIDLGEQAKGTYFMRVNGMPVNVKLMIE